MMKSERMNGEGAEVGTREVHPRGNQFLGLVNRLAEVSCFYRSLVNKKRLAGLYCFSSLSFFLCLFVSFSSIAPNQ
jgi:hypothetical protein